MGRTGFEGPSLAHLMQRIDPSLRSEAAGKKCHKEGSCYDMMAFKCCPSDLMEHIDPSDAKAARGQRATETHW
eukprot:scaffold147304_cov35-Tisochrysis_lutea.AAC.3